MTEDKQAIEAILKAIEYSQEPCNECKYYVLDKRCVDDTTKVCKFRTDNVFADCQRDRDLAILSLQTLTSLGYVKLAEQKLPKELISCGFGCEEVFNKVDSEGCAYRRVRVNV